MRNYSINFLVFLILAVVASAQVAPVIAVATKTVTITASADGTQPFTYQWFRNGDPLDGETKPELVITDPKATGVYFCRISNSAGEADTPTVRLSNTSQASMADYTLTRK